MGLPTTTTKRGLEPILALLAGPGGWRTMLILLLLVVRQQHVQVCLLPRPAGLSWVRLQFPSPPYSCFAFPSDAFGDSRPLPSSPASNKPLVVVGRG